MSVGLGRPAAAWSVGAVGSGARNAGCCACFCGP